MKAKVTRGGGFGGLLRYALDEKKGLIEGIKDAEIVSSNMAGRNSVELAREFGAVRSLRTEMKKPVWHCSLSLTAGEEVSQEKWDLIIRDHLKEMGIDVNNHQFVACIHKDTDHQHVHIVVNRIGLDGELWHGRNDVKKAIESTQVLEKRHGLIQTVGLHESQKLSKRLSQGEARKEIRTGETPDRVALADIVRKARDSSGSLKQFVGALQKKGVQLSPNGNSGVVGGISFLYKGTPYKGSRLGTTSKELGWAALSKAVNYEVAKDAVLISELRAEREDTNHKTAVDLEKDFEVASYADLRDAAMTDLFGSDSVITIDRFDEVIRTVKDVSPENEEAVRIFVKEQLQECGKNARGDQLYTTTAILNREAGMIAGARALASETRHDLSDKEIARAIEKKEYEASRKSGRIVTMSEEQRDGVRHALKGAYSGIQGSAGAGKSFTMEAVKLGYEDKGYKVIGAAIAKRAAQNLEDETGIKSYTIAKLVGDLDKGKIKLDAKTCLIIDEAGQVGSGYLATLIKHTEKAGAKIVFTGEDKQLDAIQHGGSLRFLSREDIIGTARIQTIMRQDEAWARDAVADYRDGRMEKGLAAFEERGLVRWQTGGIDATREALIQDWHAYERANPGKSALIIAHSNVHARELGDKVREIRKAEGIIVGPEFKLKCAHADKAYTLKLAQGDRIRFNKNDERGLGVINGTLGTIKQIKEIEENGKKDYRLTVLTDDKGEVTFLASDYIDEKGRTALNQANAMTVYSSQGVTVKGDVFVLQTPGMDRANTYVANSRAKNNTHTFIDRDALAAVARDSSDKAVRKQLLKHMSRDNAKSLATEHMLAANPNYLSDVLKPSTSPTVSVQTEAQAPIAAPFSHKPRGTTTAKPAAADAAEAKRVLAARRAAELEEAALKEAQKREHRMRPK